MTETSNVLAPRPTFNDVARLIARPEPPPDWLAALLEWWTAGVKTDCAIDRAYPLKRAQLNDLIRTRESASAILTVCDRFRAREYLGSSPLLGSNDTVQLKQRLCDLLEKIDPAILQLTKGGDKARAGRPPLLAKTRCAARISEAWKFLHGEDPATRNLQAAEAAQAYWLACGGSNTGWGNTSLNSWRHHFNRAKVGTIVKLRCVWRRDLAQTAHRGRPPWFLPANY
jgi:hypothetical protein